MILFFLWMALRTSLTTRRLSTCEEVRFAPSAEAPATQGSCHPAHPRRTHAASLLVQAIRRRAGHRRRGHRWTMARRPNGSGHRRRGSGQPRTPGPTRMRSHGGRPTRQILSRRPSLGRRPALTRRTRRRRRRSTARIRRTRRTRSKRVGRRLGPLPSLGGVAGPTLRTGKGTGPTAWTRTMTWQHRTGAGFRMS